MYAPGNANVQAWTPKPAHGRPNVQAMNLLDFPNEIFVQILSFLSVEDIHSLSLVCKSLQDITRIDEVWRLQSKKDYEVTIHPGGSFSCRNFYFKVLKQYGGLLGLWQVSITSYGGLLEVKYEDGALVASEYHAIHPFVEKPLRSRTMFLIRLNINGEVGPICFGDNREPHSATIFQTDDPNAFHYSCGDLSVHKHLTTMQDHKQEFMDWFHGELGTAFNAEMFPYSKELLLMKMLTIMRYNMNFEYKRLEWPMSKAKEPIEPGLFKGTYGAHGIELIMLSFEETNRVKATKITGDPNVPAQEVTFWVNLNFPLTLNCEEQQTIRNLNAIDVVEVSFDSSKPTPGPQPFRLPADCPTRHNNVPDTCLYRFQAWGQIAGHGFSNPSFSGGHWIVFSQDVFGFLWLELSMLSMYFRVHDFDKSVCKC